MLTILTTKNFLATKSYTSLHLKVLQNLGLRKDDVQVFSSWDDVVESGATHCLYLCQFPPHAKASPYKSELRDVFPSGVDNCRGSRYFHDGVEIIMTHHPLDCNVDYKLWVLVMNDTRRLLGDQREGFKESKFEIHIADTKKKVFDSLSLLTCNDDPSFITYADIEGSLDTGGVTCIGFSLSKSRGFTIPFHDLDGNNIFNVREEIEIWDLVQKVLWEVKTGWQNYLYDSFVLAYGYGITIAKPVEDTMLKTWELFCEFPKSLGFQTSFYTDHPFYKNERTAPSLKEQLEYNVKDCCITHACSEAQEKLLERDPLSMQNYHNNMHRLPILLFFQLQGINFDRKEKARLKRGLTKEIAELQKEIDEDWLLTDDGLKKVGEYCKQREKVETSVEKYRGRLEIARGEIETRKENDKPVTKKLLNDLRVCENQLRLLPERLANVEYPSFNAKSSLTKAKYLYTKGGLGLKKPARAPTESACDALSLIKVIVAASTSDEKKEKVQKLMRLIEKRTQLQDVEKLRVDPLDGCIRCSYNLVGSETGRLSCRESNVPEKGYKI